MHKKLTRIRKKELGLLELIAIALGGMVGGGIFAILGISVEQIGNATPIAIAIGGGLAMLAAYSYIKLTLYYKDEGATYSFFKKTFPNSPFAAAAIGWLVVFGYISTLALYAFTFSSYFCTILSTDVNTLLKDMVAGGIILIFVIINLVSVKGMGKIEDIMVYTKLIILLIISGLLAGKGDVSNIQPVFAEGISISSIIVVSSLTFVAFEGFQLVIHAYEEMESPETNIPKAIYSAVLIATILYIGISIGALFALPKEMIIQDKEYALASGATEILGSFGYGAVIFGALLATSSAISGTLFGASRLMAVIANDGYFPSILGHHNKKHIPSYAIITMAILAFVLILTGTLSSILEFGSITFILVSFLMAYSNFTIRDKTHTNIFYAIFAMVGLTIAAGFIIYYEINSDAKQVISIVSIYIALAVGAYLFSKKKQLQT